MPGRQEPHLNGGRFKIRNHSFCNIRPRSFFSLRLDPWVQGLDTLLRRVTNIGALVFDWVRLSLGTLCLVARRTVLIFVEIVEQVICQSGWMVFCSYLIMSLLDGFSPPCPPTRWFMVSGGGAACGSQTFPSPFLSRVSSSRAVCLLFYKRRNKRPIFRCILWASRRTHFSQSFSLLSSPRSNFSFYPPSPTIESAADIFLGRFFFTLSLLR